MITIGVYENIANLTNSAQDRGGAIVTSMDNMKDNLDIAEGSSDNYDRTWLRNIIVKSTTTLSNNNYEVTLELRKFVFELQKYVEDNYTGGVNSFLSDNNTKVGQTFADVSALVGYPIDSGNIDT
jgi:hypothetical protein